MARKRMVSPDLPTSGPVSTLDFRAAYGWVLLWGYLDDYGRGEDDPPLVRSQLHPRRPKVTDAQMAADLDAWAERGLICRYVVGGYRLLHAVSWHEHQNISHRGKPKYPPCPVHEELLYDEFRRDSGGPLAKYRRVTGGRPDGLHSNVVEVSRDESSSSVVCDHGHPRRSCISCAKQAVSQ